MLMSEVDVLDKKRGKDFSLKVSKNDNSFASGKVRDMPSMPPSRHSSRAPERH